MKLKRILLILSFVVAGIFLCLGLLTHSGIGNKALIVACRNGNYFISSVLVTSGADVNAHDNFGRNALFYAAANGYEKIVRLLLDSGTDARTTDVDGNTAICYALGSSIPHLEIITMLAERGALDRQSETASPYYCIANSSSGEVYAQYLIDHHIDFNKADSDGYTPLMMFSGHGTTNIIFLLLKYGANVNARAKSGRTALSEAATKGEDDTVKLLLQAGATPNILINGKRLSEIVNEQAALHVGNTVMSRKFVHVQDLLSANSTN